MFRGQLFVGSPVGGVAASAVDHLFSNLNLLGLVLTFLLRRSLVSKDSKFAQFCQGLALNISSSLERIYIG